MKIGIIGAGSMARVLCRHAVNAGHSVMLSNSRGKNSLVSLASAAGGLAGTPQEAADYGEIVIIAIPLGAYQSLPREPLQEKIVLDLLNYFPHRDGNIPELQRGELTTSELLAKHLPRTRIVKAFNSITVDDLITDPRPVGASARRALPIAGDDQEAKIIASRLIDELGFDVVDAGNLADSWRFEKFRPVYCVALDKEALKATLASTSRDSKVPDGYWLHNRQVLL
jgi:8-hydroxy-5-deazaflavin:NADPH oxidoreductase